MKLDHLGGANMEHSCDCSPRITSLLSNLGLAYATRQRKSRASVKSGKLLAQRLYAHFVGSLNYTDSIASQDIRLALNGAVTPLILLITHHS